MSCVLVDGKGLFVETCCLCMRIGSRTNGMGLYGAEIRHHRNTLCKILRRVSKEFD